MKKIIRKLVQVFQGIAKWAMEEEKSIYGVGSTGKGFGFDLHSVWDYLQFTAHSQAAHITGVLGFDEWVDMDEIRRRISNIFSIDYKNDRSLYPYIKTLTDCGLLETTSAGGRRRWRKKELFIKIRREAAEGKVEARTEKPLTQVGTRRQ